MPAYLLTFTCYGTHIPGHQGTIDRNHNLHGARIPDPNPKLRQYVDANLKQSPHDMDPAQRTVTLNAIVEVCHRKDWHLLAAQVRSTHVHVVVDADVAPEIVMTIFKSYASRALNARQPGQRNRIRWARHGSTRYLWSKESIDAAVVYVLDKQGERMAWYEAAPSVRSLTVAVPFQSQIKTGTSTQNRARKQADRRSHLVDEFA